MVKILAVYDADPAFGERLADYVNQKEKIPFTAMAFSSLDRLIEYGSVFSLHSFMLYALYGIMSYCAFMDIRRYQIPNRALAAAAAAGLSFSRCPVRTISS